MTQAQLAQLGFNVTQGAHARLARFVALLMAENKQLNLTGIRDEEKIWELHICDSLAIAPLVAAAGASRLIDLGSGCGVPGIPLACVSQTLSVTLLDATRKKVAALDRIVAGLDIDNVRTVWGRAESLAGEPPLSESFDGVTARAVAPLKTLIEYAAGFIRVGGRCWFSKSCDIETETPQAGLAAHRYHLRLIDTHRYTLPANHGERLIVEYEKMGVR